MYRREKRWRSKYKAKEKNDFIPTEFNPLTYKMYRCPLGPICKLDRKFCLNYHMF